MFYFVTETVGNQALYFDDKIVGETRPVPTYSVKQMREKLYLYSIQTLFTTHCTLNTVLQQDKARGQMVVCSIIQSGHLRHFTLNSLH